MKNVEKCSLGIVSTNFYFAKEEEITTVYIYPTTTAPPPATQHIGNLKRTRTSNLTNLELLGKELNYPGRLYGPTVIAEISRGHETPM